MLGQMAEKTAWVGISATSDRPIPFPLTEKKGHGNIALTQRKYEPFHIKDKRRHTGGIERAVLPGCFL